MASVRGLVDRVDAAARAAGRDDLQARLCATRARLDDPALRVVVLGEFGAGKSALVNALVGASVCPVDDDAATAVPTSVSSGPTPACTLVHADGADGAGERRTDVPLASLADHVLERGERGEGDDGEPRGAGRLLRAEVALPAPLLAGGLVLVDTPGAGGLSAAHALAALDALTGASAVLFVTDAATEHTEPELELLARAASLCPEVAVVLTKTDLHPHWRAVADADAAHRARAGLDLPVFACSAALHLRGLRAGDAQLVAEAGVAAVQAHLRDAVVGAAAQVSHRVTAHDLLAVLDNLELAARAEADALRDPERAAARAQRLAAARATADALRARSARWNTTLGDGTADLVADLDHDLRDRVRAITRDAEEALDDVDPAKVWDQFEAWLEARVASAIAEDFVWADQRARALAARVAEHFEEDGRALLPDLDLDLPEGDTDAALELLSPLGGLPADGAGPVARLVTGLRGSYSGIVMVGLLTGLAGMTLLNPLSLGAGLLLGGKTYRDDARARLLRRRAEAKNAVRRHLDDVVFQVSKASRDRLRSAQRTVRDHFTSLAEELHRSLGESLEAASRAVSADDAERVRRLGELEEQLGQLAALRASSRALAAAGTPALPEPAPAVAGAVS